MTLNVRVCISYSRAKVPGLEVVKPLKINCFGKPGAGKQRFLKHIAIQRISGKFQADPVPTLLISKGRSWNINRFHLGH